MYRKRTTCSRKLAAARAARDAARMAGPSPDYPPDLPKLRRVVVVIDYDQGTPVIETMRLYRTNRVDSYCVEVNGSIWHKRIGWSGVCEGIRKSFIRLASSRHFV
jgi:hypothetical protein